MSLKMFDTSEGQQKQTNIVKRSLSHDTSCLDLTDRCELVVDHCHDLTVLDIRITT